MARATMMRKAHSGMARVRVSSATGRYAAALVCAGWQPDDAGAGAYQDEAAWREIRRNGKHAGAAPPVELAGAGTGKAGVKCGFGGKTVAQQGLGGRRLGKRGTAAPLDTAG